MKVRDLAYETGSALLANRVRSLLTILGIVIGIAAVIALTSLIDGMRAAIVGQLGLNAARTVEIVCWPPNNRQLTEVDVETMARDLAGDYDFITCYAYAWSSVSSSTSTSEEMDITACDEKFFEARGLKAEKGRVFTAEENEESSMVVVLGGASVKKLFGRADADAVGKTVRIGNDTYTVVGTLESDSMQGDWCVAYIPYRTAKVRLIGQQSGAPLNIFGFARESADIYGVAERTDSYLRAKYNIPEADPDGGGSSEEGYCHISTAQSMLDQLESTMSSFRLMAFAVAGISLLVGGIGIMNMMLTNVTERIREIGLRKALGAKRADITAQFLLESIAICIVGGGIGVAVGYGAAWLLAGLAGSSLGYENLVPVITPQTALLAAGICCGIGVLFGFYPARRAARLDPVEALRYQ